MITTNYTIAYKKEPLIKNYYDFNQFVYRYSDLLHRYANWLVPVKAAAGRIVTSALCELLKNKHRLYTEKEVRTFLKKNIRQQSMNWLRTETLRQRKTNNKK